jgi:hypothetical protein
MSQPDVNELTLKNQASEQLVRQFYVPFNTGTVEIYDEILSSDWVDDPLEPGLPPGPAGIKAKVTKFRQNIPGYHVTIDEILVDGSRVAVHSTVTSDLRRPATSAQPASRPFAMRTCDFHHIANGQIVYTWHLEDFYGLYQYLGTLPGH